jgi:hypothetical protein
LHVAGVGEAVGAGVGNAVGEVVGEVVGRSVGTGVVSVGEEVGCRVGAKEGAGVSHFAFLQFLLLQSELLEHDFLAGQEWQSIPPQSTSDSRLFLTLSLQLTGVGDNVGDFDGGGWHML